jgi:hypothetical protein
VLCCGNLSNFEVCFRVNTLIKNSVVVLVCCYKRFLERFFC